MVAHRWPDETEAGGERARLPVWLPKGKFGLGAAAFVLAKTVAGNPRNKKDAVFVAPDYGFKSMEAVCWFSLKWTAGLSVREYSAVFGGPICNRPNTVVANDLEAAETAMVSGRWSHSQGSARHRPLQCEGCLKAEAERITPCFN